MASTFSYYMILFYMKYLPGNIFTNTIYCSTADVIGYLFTGILFQYVGGKASLIASFGIASVSGLCLLSFSDQPHLTSVFLFGSRLGVAAACNVLTIVNITVFPSDFRATSFGLCNIFARFAAIVAPIVAELEDPLPFVSLVVMVTLCAGLSWFLLEKQVDEES